MAQTLEHQQNVTVTPITLTPFSADVDVIQKLDDEPNDVGGLTAQELKEEFDKNGNAIKTFINGTLIPEVIGADATEQARQEAENERVANEIERVSNENARVTAENNRVTAETNRSLFENYDSTKSYKVGNKVAYQGSSYRCKLQTSAGTLPTDTTYWDLIAKKGDKGDKGDTGETGVDSASATIGTGTGTPTVSVTLDGNKNLAFAFDGLKGSKGDKGDRGDPGAGDMSSVDYDRNQTVKNAGGIPTYVGMQLQDKSDKSLTYSGTLDADSWSSNQQTISISGLATSGYIYIVSPKDTDTEKWAEAQIYALDVTTANQITFKCVNTPTEDIDVTILKVQVA